VVVVVVEMTFSIKYRSTLSVKGGWVKWVDSFWKYKICLGARHLVVALRMSAVLRNALEMAERSLSSVPVINMY